VKHPAQHIWDLGTGSRNHQYGECALCSEYGVTDHRETKPLNGTDLSTRTTTGYVVQLLRSSRGKK